MKIIKTLLVANRGEIAVRVMKSAKKMGIKTLSLYTKGEENLPHVLKADQALFLGEGNLSETYLNQNKIIKLAKQAGADAIHPGYGFLSENAEFSKKVGEAGIIFVGPTPEVITLMGDKKTSKQTLEKIGTPMIPGYHGDNQEPDFLLSQAKKIEWPVLIKASAGGGGKGMRVVDSEKDFFSSLETAKREALKSFGDDRVLLEKYLVSPHHIEVQIMGDHTGQVVHLYERECSIQRRHQKIVEETPSPSLDEKLRKMICETAVKIGSHLGYTNAGTVEFIMDGQKKFYFLEMNTRLQVEHPITEMITGIDLVEWQIKVAQGELLPLPQEKILSSGHAIEVRICAEDPDQEFLPTAGRITRMGQTDHTFVRLDTGYADGQWVSSQFDPMLAKLIAWGEDRNQARLRLTKALDKIVFLGPRTNRSYLQRVLEHPAFVAGQTTTDFVVKNKEELLPPKLSSDLIARAIAGSLVWERKNKLKNGQPPLDVEDLSNFRNI